ncbi:Inner membrane protein alx [bacterium HR30]|nr:Inner membrane protein alx [bacterium HR30]
MHMTDLWLWVSFGILLVLLLAWDLGVLHRRPHEVRFREALWQSAFWIVLALIFNAAVYVWRGPQSGLEFLTAYLIEKSLSVDNIFVFIMIFQFFRVPGAYQHRVLFWGVLGALVMRAVFIVTGIRLLEWFHWMTYVFGAFLIFTGVKLVRDQGKEVDPMANPVIRWLRSVLPFRTEYEGPRFVVHHEGRRYFTPLFLTLLVVEFTDLVFAIDSIPAVLAVSRDLFIVYTSNAFAILGLRALYFVVAGFMLLFAYLSYGLAAILVFVGVKMMIADIYHVPITWSLAFIAATLAVALLASLLKAPEPVLPPEVAEPKPAEPVTTKSLYD